MVVAGVALVVAGAGVGAANTHLITGAEVQNGTLTGADIRNGSVGGADIRNGSVGGADIRNGSVHGRDIRNGTVRLNDLTSSTRRAVTTGSQGPQGPTGPQGAQGPQGPAGSPGVSGRVVVENSQFTPADSGFPVEKTLTAQCPPGTTVLGGGASISDENSLADSFLAASEPTAGDTGWTATVRSKVSVSGTLRVKAICAVVG